MREKFSVVGGAFPLVRNVMRDTARKGRDVAVGIVQSATRPLRREAEYRRRLDAAREREAQFNPAPVTRDSEIKREVSRSMEGFR